MMPKLTIAKDLQDKVNSLLLGLDKRDPRLQEMLRVINDTYSKAQKIRPYDTIFASSEAYKAVLEYLKKFPELNDVTPKKEHSDLAAISKIIKPEGIMPWSTHLYNRDKVVVMPKPNLIVVDNQNKPLEETVIPYVATLRNDSICLADGSNYIGLLRR